MSDASPSPERLFWTVFEPIHAISYFHPDFAAAMVGSGLTGWWNGYFAGRAAPLGRVGAPAVTSLFFVFAPSRVAKAVPEVWRHIDPVKAVETRLATADEVLSQFTSDHALPDLREALTALRRCVDGLDFGGRALAAAWAGVPPPSTLLGQIWLAATVLREHRGDGHVIASVENGLTGLQASITHVATGKVQRERIQVTRGWSDEEWRTAEAELVDRGILDGSGALTARGAALRDRVEETTDRLAARSPVLPEDPSRVIRVLRVLSADIRRHPSFPDANPIGVPHPMAKG
ncbi:SCO6745 family protein [Actinocorallia libanotica]